MPTRWRRRRPRSPALRDVPLSSFASLSQQEPARKIFDKTRATATGGRSGRTALDDGSLALDLATPGSGKTGANPEQLFAMGYAACFDNALPVAAKQLGLAPTGTRTSNGTSTRRRPTRTESPSSASATRCWSCW